MTCLSLRLRIAVFVPLVAALAAVAVGCALAAQGSTSAGTAPGSLAIGKQLYRQYCGQCHALTEALAVGSGSYSKFGQDGGPSFNDLDVPYALSIDAVTEQFGGHELVVKKLSWPKLQQVSKFVALATKTHPYLARISDG
ncbi:MAG TPA: hypothetical protein VH063_06420 [Gaiellaceae bacterium]|nr:hypothetical protein [Gaiellaceae bacterium]